MTTRATTKRTINTVLIANRGEIACRIITSLWSLGIKSVAVYSDADADAEHVRMADVAVRIGPAPATQSYLKIDAIVDAALRTGADAVHPGYGFLSENAAFADALAQAGLIFIGPPTSAIATMGDKITARAAVEQRGVPVVPGLSRPGLTDGELISAAGDVGFPVLIKPSAGGGGKGMHRVDDPAELPDALAAARREAASAFGDDTLFLEHFVETPRHIEVQILADEHGNVIHLGERECSLQRRHQKVIEEAPSALLDPETRARIGEAACDAARSVGYTGAGTVEFIVSAHRPDEFFFMEMNTRLQVEHPVTEMVTGIDLVAQQIAIARGEPLTLQQNDIHLDGHAIEARVYAEDPARGFLPSGGEITALTEPGGLGVRIDSAMRPGLRIGTDYDPMLAKVIAHGADRAQAIARLDDALAATRVLGVRTNIDFCRAVLADDDVRAGRLDTALLDRFVVDYVRPQPDPGAWVTVALAEIGARDVSSAWESAVGWRIGGPAPVIADLTVDDPTTGDPTQDRRVVRTEMVVTTAHGPHLVARARIIDRTDDSVLWSGPVEMDWDTNTPDHRQVCVDGISRRWTVSRDDTADGWWVAGAAGTWLVRRVRALVDSADDDHAGEITSPMPGTVVAVPAADGDEIAAGATVVVVEAMKMEHALKAPFDGVVTVKATAGDKVSAGQVLAFVERNT